MKKILKTLILLSFISMTAQVEPIFLHQWSLEKVVIDDEEILAELDYNGYEVGVNFYGNAGFYQFIFDDFVSDIVYDNPNQSFVIESFDFTLGGSHETAAADAVKEPFLYINEFIDGQTNITLNNPFPYDFREEGDIIYLDITNSLGDIATFWASTLNTENFDKGKFLIYPNPAGNQLNIQSEIRDIQRIEIYNLNGKRVLQSQYSLHEAIDISSLLKGIYLLKIKTKNGSFTKKLVKE